jgi:hypothetical protein
MSYERWLPSDDLDRLPVERDGVRLRAPKGWDARIRREVAKGGDNSFTVLHAATVPLPADRADYGGGVVETLLSSDVFLALIEFGPDEAGSALFPDVEALPTLEVGMFHRHQLQRRLRGQAGVQHFFTLGGRAFCLYVVLGSMANAGALVAMANETLEGLSIQPR